MEKLLPASANLAEHSALGNGTLNILELLKQHADLENVELATELPAEAIEIHWSEVRTPNINSNLGKEILGAKLLDYKFQYIASFSYNGEAIVCKDWMSKKDEECYELFDARMGSRTVHETKLAGNGTCNCTWLIDFLKNAASIAQDSLRADKLRWRKTYDGFRLTLTSSSSDGRLCESQEFIFSSDFKYMKWEHHTAISELA
ncbi:MAG: hypothetical protein MK212_13635 [Saprospiraceae bacterium]|nr:hypothetical protein [Saprospiraceae bacterium]